MDNQTLLIVGAVVVVILLLLILLLRSRKQHVDFSAPAAKVAPPPAKPAVAPTPTAAPAPTPTPPAIPIPADAPVAPVEPEPVPLAEAPATAVEPGLTRLKGLGPKAAARLGELGVTRVEQIAAWSDADIARIDAEMGAFKGRIVRDRWVEQARLLASGDTAAYEAAFGKLGG